MIRDVVTKYENGLITLDEPQPKGSLYQADTTLPDTKLLRVIPCKGVQTTSFLLPFKELCDVSHSSEPYSRPSAGEGPRHPVFRPHS